MKRIFFILLLISVLGILGETANAEIVTVGPHTPYGRIDYWRGRYQYQPSPWRTVNTWHASVGVAPYDTAVVRNVSESFDLAHGGTQMRTYNHIGQLATTRGDDPWWTYYEYNVHEDSFGPQLNWYGSFDVNVPPGSKWMLTTSITTGLPMGRHFYTGPARVEWHLTAVMNDFEYILNPLLTVKIGGEVVRTFQPYQNGKVATWTLQIINGNYEFHDPIVTANPDLEVLIGQSVNWSAGITATWGHSTGNTIPTMGEIRDTSLIANNDLDLSITGTTYDRIGVKTHTYEIRDSMSLMNIGITELDNTVTVINRKIIVRTPATPLMTVRYAVSAVDVDGNSIAGNIYNITDLITDSGGEEGWTNQPLDIRVDPNSIPGTFDTILKIPGLTNVVVTNDIASYTGYYDETLDTGITASGVLAEVENVMTPEIENDNDLSGIVYGSWKLDKTPPVAGATHDGGFTFTDTSNDGLSGLSVSRPSLIAIVPTGDTPISTDYKLFSDITSLPLGNYDIYVKATDKAGNEHVNPVFTNYILGGAVTIEKDTNEGATLHVNDCPVPNSELVTIDAACTILGCSIGNKADIEERSDLTYELTIVNTDSTENGIGTFTDYLPKECLIITPPSFTGSDPMNDVTFVYGAPEPPGPYEGQIKVTGTYTIKAGSTIDIAIPCKVPSFDKDPSAINIISNQASLEWTLGAGDTATTGTYESNFANHQLLELPSVEAKFKKVGSDDLNIGLVGTEFVLYKWTGTDSEYTGGNHDQDIVNKETLLDGKWQRVKKDGEDALALTDVFVSNGSGDVDLGDLPSGIYTLIETKTVATYEIPVGQWILSVNATKGDSGTVGDWRLEFVGKSNSIMPPAVARVGGGGGIAPEYKVLNAKPFSIGLTGLGGTTRFFVIGLSLMFCASVTYIIISRKNKTENCQ